MGIDIKLNKKIKPINYNIKIEPKSGFRFEGSEIINCYAEGSVKEVVLNAKELEIKNAYIENDEYVRIGVSISNDKNNEIVAFRFGKPVSGNFNIHVNFEGINNERMYGFYRSGYIEKGIKKYLLTTQLEAANARAVFPCFDEPSFKSTFELSLIIDKNLVAVSNTPIKTERVIGLKRMVSFEKTPVMSTYLLYIGIGDFKSISGRIDGIKIRVLTTPEKIGLAKLPLEYAKKILKAYENYFGMKYQLPKLDLLAIPDFAAGAMENWGAITFREEELLGDKNSAITTKSGIANVIAHEFAHQWFGDIVTMEWWDDLWLNESFATFMSYKIEDECYPEFKKGIDFITEMEGSALYADESKNTRPIYAHIKSVGEIDNMFDPDITYAKGASVLYMIEDFLGKETFRKGIHAYLKKYSFKNASKEDLWDSLEDAAKLGNGKKLRDIANMWVTKAGYPVVEVKSDKKGIELSQKRFSLSKKTKSDMIWRIPIHYIMDNGKDMVMLLDKKSYRIRQLADWILLNYKHTGFFRVAYNKRMLESIGSGIKKDKINGIDSWGLLNDRFALLRTNRIKLDDYALFIEKYLFDSDYPLNVYLLHNMAGLYLLCYGKDFAKRFNEVNKRYALYIFNKTGWESKKGEDFTIKELRSAAITSLGILGYEPVVKKSMELFEKIMDGKSIDRNLFEAVYYTVAWNGDEKIFEKMLHHYDKIKLPEERLYLLRSFGKFKDKKLIKRVLELSLSERIRPQDAPRIAGSVSSNPFGKDILWKWQKSNWKNLMKMYPFGTLMLYDYAMILNMQTDKKIADEIRDFFKIDGNVRDDIKDTIKKSMERIDSNITFLKSNK